MGGLEVVKVFNSRIDAEIARGYLENMGIKAQIMADDAGQLYPSIGQVRGIKLLVKKESADSARDLLDIKED